MEWRCASFKRYHINNSITISLGKYIKSFENVPYTFIQGFGNIICN